MFEFKWPLFVLLIPLPLILWLIAHYKAKNSINKTNNIEVYFPRLERLKVAYAQQKKYSISKKSHKLLLFLLWSSIIIALMRPQIANDFVAGSNSGRDIILAVDISQSMDALDFSTMTKEQSRLDVTKKVVSDFVKNRKGDRVGLVIFADKSYLYSPLTYDLASVSKLLNEVEIEMAGGGTAIGDAIGVAINHFKNKKLKSKIIILLSDGADNASTLKPSQAAEFAAKNDIKIYTVGIGAKKVAKIRFNGVVQYHHFPLNEVELKNIAKITGGKYAKAQSTTELKSIYSQIDKLETTKGESKSVYIANSLHYIPLVLSLLLIVLLAMENTRRKYGIN